MYGTFSYVCTPSTQLMMKIIKKFLEKPTVRFEEYYWCLFCFVLKEISSDSVPGYITTVALCSSRVWTADICFGWSNMGDKASLYRCDLSAIFSRRALLKCNSLLVSVSSGRHDDSRATFTPPALCSWLSLSLSLSLSVSLALHMTPHWYAASLPSQNTREGCCRAPRQMTGQICPPAG